jgi:hypothetical protein
MKADPNEIIANGFFAKVIFKIFRQRSMVHAKGRNNTIIRKLLVWAGIGITTFVRKCDKPNNMRHPVIAITDENNNVTETIWAFFS